jgi:hypothetical protein
MGNSRTKRSVKLVFCKGHSGCIWTVLDSESFRQVFGALPTESASRKMANISLGSETSSKCIITDEWFFCIILRQVKNYMIEIKSKLKLIRYTPRKRLDDRRYSSYLFLTSALDGSEWSASHPGRDLHLRKGPPVPIGQEAGWASEPVWHERNIELYKRL